jgi:uncharacterized protein YdiU (UPF0061 family)
MDLFDPRYQPWTGGGAHFSFLNQPKAAQINFEMFCKSLMPLLASSQTHQERLQEIQNGFPHTMQLEMIAMWSAKLGLTKFDTKLFSTLMELVVESSADYTIFFRELSKIPDDVTALQKSFYTDISKDKNLLDRWSNWLKLWLEAINAADEESR